MRWLLPLLCVGCATGVPGTDAPATCGEAECAAACAEAEAGVVVPAGGERLTAFEGERLHETLGAVRRGLIGRGRAALLWCTGIDRCEQAINPRNLANLPAGTYVLVPSLRVPPRGTWAVTVDLHCSEGGPADQHVRVSLDASSGAGTGPYVPVTVPARWGGECVVRLTGPDGVKMSEDYASFTERPRPLVLLTAAQLAEEPPPPAATTNPTRSVDGPQPTPPPPPAPVPAP